jgi:hypothetical protein
MRQSTLSTGLFLVAAFAMPAFAQQRGNDPASQTPAPPVDDAIKTLVGRLDVEKYKATIKGLTVR